jgi:hypothetical protein
MKSEEKIFFKTANMYPICNARSARVSAMESRRLGVKRGDARFSSMICNAQDVRSVFIERGRKFFRSCD